MNNEKAREFFSSYFEGTLEPGLRQSFERKLSSNSELNREYRMFENALSELSDLKLEDIPIPSDLHEIISARIDRSIYEQKRSTAAGSSSLWRNLALGSLALAAIVGAVITIPRLGGKSSAAGLVGGFEAARPVPTGGRLDFRARGNAVLLEATASADHVLSIQADGKMLRRISLRANEQTETPLENQQAHSVLVTVAIVGDPSTHYVAIPGQQTTNVRSGQGDLSTLAKALADVYQVPVLLEVADLRQVVQWNFVAKDPVNAAIGALYESHLTVEQREGSLLTIADR